MNTFTAEHTPADIVRLFPKASDLFKIQQIDFCCGGDQPLRETFFNNDNLDEAAVLSELNIAYNGWKNDGNQAIDWDALTPTELVDHITKTHHSYLKMELPALGEFVTRIFRVHGSDQPHLRELHQLYNEFKLEMIEHTSKEDNQVFPLIKEYEKNPSNELLKKIHSANGSLEEEHEVAGDLLKQMRVITNGFTTPENACGSYHITYDRLAEMEENTFQHVHLENNVLFKKI